MSGGHGHAATDAAQLKSAHRTSVALHAFPHVALAATHTPSQKVLLRQGQSDFVFLHCPLGHMKGASGRHVHFSRHTLSQQTRCGDKHDEASTHAVIDVAHAFVFGQRYGLV